MSEIKSWIYFDIEYIQYIPIGAVTLAYEIYHFYVAVVIDFVGKA